MTKYGDCTTVEHLRSRAAALNDHEMLRAIDVAYGDGYRDGHAEGYNKGHDAGYDAGQEYRG